MPAKKYKGSTRQQTGDECHQDLDRNVTDTHATGTLVGVANALGVLMGGAEGGVGRGVGGVGVGGEEGAHSDSF